MAYPPVESNVGARLDIRAMPGADFYLGRVVYAGDPPALVDLSGKTGRLHVVAADGSTVLDAELVIDVEAGVFEVFVAPEDLPPPGTTHQYTISFIDDADGYVTPVYTGTFAVPDVPPAGAA